MLLNIINQLVHIHLNQVKRDFKPGKINFTHLKRHTKPALPGCKLVHMSVNKKKSTAKLF